MPRRWFWNPLKSEAPGQDLNNFLECLDLHLRVQDHTRLDETALRNLSESPTFRRVAHGLIGQLLRGGALGGNSFSGRHGQSVVIISDDWTVSIHSIDMYNCVSAMCALVNTITGDLGATLAIEVITTPDGDEVTLEGLMAEVADSQQRRLRKDKIRDIVIGAVLGAVLSGIGCWAVDQFL